MSQFDFSAQKPQGRPGDRPAPARKGSRLSGEVRVLVWLGIVVLAAVVVAGGWYGARRWYYIPHVVKPRELEQRKLYEKYERLQNAKRSLAIEDVDPIVGDFEADSAEGRQKFREAQTARLKKKQAAGIREVEAGLAGLEKESSQRWGVAPDAFKHFQSSDSPYYRE